MGPKMFSYLKLLAKDAQFDLNLKETIRYYFKYILIFQIKLAIKNKLLVNEDWQ